MTFLVATGGPTGALWMVADGTPARRIAEVPDASFALQLADGRVLALCGGEAGIVRLFAPSDDDFVEVDAGSSGGGEPCYAVLDPAETHVLIINYGPPSVAVWPIDAPLESLTTSPLPTEGSGILADRQDSSHPHHAVFITSDEVLISDLGADAILRCTWHNGELQYMSSIPTPPGSGPRHIAADDNLIAISAELSNEILAAERASLEHPSDLIEWARKPATMRGESASSGLDNITYPGDIAIDPAGEILVANRGADTLTRFRYTDEHLRIADEQDAGGLWPQRILADDHGQVVAARDSGLIIENGKPISNLEKPVWISRWR